MVFQTELTLHTHTAGEMHDLTDAVARIVTESGMHTGIVQIFNVGSTGAIGAIEFEPGLEQDLPALLRRLIPPSRDYAHEQTWRDGNGHSHLQAMLLGPRPVRDGETVLGTWHQIFHIECDVRPGERTVVVTVLGDYRAAIETGLSIPQRGGENYGALAEGIGLARASFFYSLS